MYKIFCILRYPYTHMWWNPFEWNIRSTQCGTYWCTKNLCTPNKAHIFVAVYILGNYFLFLMKKTRREPNFLTVKYFSCYRAGIHEFVLVYNWVELSQKLLIISSSNHELSIYKYHVVLNSILEYENHQKMRSSFAYTI